MVSELRIHSFTVIKVQTKYQTSGNNCLQANIW